MNVTIKINCDNSAFCPETSGEYAEVSRMLANLAVEIDKNGFVDSERALFDNNGNRVGYIKTTK
jgi:hypothetical protein